MYKKGFKKVWVLLERFICYFALTVIVISHIVQMIFPNFPSVSNEIAICAFGAALIVIFQNTEELQASIIKNSNQSISNRFNEGLDPIWKKDGKIQSLDIFCHTSKTYVHSICDNNISIENMRLLVCKPKRIETKHYPSGDATVHLNSERDSAILRWKSMHNNGLIKNLEIRYYEFDPTFHFAVINKRYLHYGLYKPEKNYPGYNLLPLYTFDSQDSDFNLSQISDLTKFFDYIFTTFSYT